MDRPRRNDCTAGQMDGEAGWWTTSGNIGLPPLAMVMGVGRQQQPYGRGILQSQSHDCLIAMSVSFCLSHPVAVNAFIICGGLCACTEMLLMCVLYASFGYKVRPKTFGQLPWVGQYVQYIYYIKLRLGNTPSTPVYNRYWSN